MTGTGHLLLFSSFLIIGAYVIEAKFAVPTVRAGQFSELRRSERTRSMTALRLAYPYCGTFHYLTHEHEGFFPDFGAGSAPETQFIRSFQVPLTSGNAHGLQKKWAAAYDYASRSENPSGALEPFLRIAAHRFRDSFDKSDSADRLLDYSIALESLFSSAGDSISYRLPLRAAIFLGNETQERRRIFEILSAAYKQRSKIAHGSGQIEKEIKIGVRKIQSSDFLDAVENCLFLALEKLWLGQPIKRDKLIAIIDECIVTQENFKMPSPSP